jgi:hypothetical protein
MAILGTADVVADLNTLGTADVVTDMNTLGTADVVLDMNTLGTAGNVTNMNTLAGISANITTVAGISANTTTVAGIAANVTSVAGNATNINSAVANAADITTVATNIADVNTVGGISANVTTVAGISANVTSVAGISANVTSVAGNSTNINTVAADATDIGIVAAANTNIGLVGGSITNVNEVATNLGSVNAFGEQYRVAATAPTTSLDAGDLWFDTTAGTMKVYDGSGFVNAGSSVNGIENSVEHIATAGQTSFTATYDAGYLNVFLNGVKLDSTDYTATDGANVVLDTGAALNDSVFIQSFGTFTLADHYSKTASDARFEPIDSTIVKDADIGVTVQGLIADNGLSGDKVDGGTISNFTSTGIDDNATSTAITISASENVSIGSSFASGVATRVLTVDDPSNAAIVVAYNGATALNLYADADEANIGSYLQGANMKFFTTPSGGSTTERMRITNAGYTKMSPNGTYVSAAGSYHEVNQNIAGITSYIYNSSATGDGLLVNVNNESTYFFLAGYSDSAARYNVYIFSNGNLVNRNNSYGALSDQKLKQDIEDASSQWEDVKAMQFRKYRWKQDVAADVDAPYQLGVIAQELEASGMSGLIEESPDREFYDEVVLDSDGNPVVDEDGNNVTEQKERLTGESTKSVKYSILTMKALVALQEAMTRIESLEARITTLENA